MKNSKNTNTKIVKCKINEGLFDLFKKALKNQKTTQQDVLEQTVRDYIVENITVLMKEEMINIRMSEVQKERAKVEE